MRTIFLLKGLPGSGKSTWAKAYLLRHPNTKRVNKDLLREMLDDSKRSKENEKFLIEIRNDIIHKALGANKDVIVDDTNFAPEHESTIRLIAEHFLAKVEVKFFDIPLAECILRDSKREKSVGEKVIRDMYEKYLKPKEEEKKFEMDTSLPKCYIFDIDGTLALMDGRSPYDYTRVGEDKPNKAIIRILTELDENNVIIIVSGRPDSCKEDTRKWLKSNGVFYEGLHMRKTGDTRKDFIVKREILDEIVKDYYVQAVFDDRNQVVKMWRNLGITCLQVAEGDF